MKSNRRIFNARDTLARLTRVHGIIRASRSDLSMSVSWTFRGSPGTAQHNRELLEMCLRLLESPYEWSVSQGPVTRREMKYSPSSGRTGTFHKDIRTERVYLAGGIFAVAWLRRAIHQLVHNERKDKLLRLAVIRSQQIKRAMQAFNDEFQQSAPETPVQTPEIPEPTPCPANITATEPATSLRTVEA